MCFVTSCCSITEFAVKPITGGLVFGFISEVVIKCQVTIATNRDRWSSVGSIDIKIYVEKATLLL